MSQIDWGLGSYEATGADLLPAARELVDAAAIRPGEHVVDIGAGTGNVALLAADLGARVTAVESAARLREVIREVSGERDVTVVDGTAASIPLADGSADVLLSNFAVIFAPDPAAAMAEMARVAGPQGRILLTSWLPGDIEEVIGLLVRAVRDLTGDGGSAQGRVGWHGPDVLNDLLGEHGFEVSATTNDLIITTSSPQEYWQTRIADHPLGVTTFPMLEQAGRLDEVRARTIDVLTERWTGTSGEVRLPAQYLLAVATR
ncbi:class I SAM-dependent methyltransferase [Kribbella sp. NBC_00889]|uniref:class I SAM-dependent methyltransferase n=1 Tax=Kribbella sp. NBC_00889 TaxID=2975974 RepID=UPI003869F6DF|nr:class I SAM-dependent methyltransferase [Kribbella sp. NBC_00889]